MKKNIEAIGNSLRTWVNGIPCADLLDDTTPSGFIALQVHSIGNNEALEEKRVAGRYCHDPSLQELYAYGTF